MVQLKALIFVQPYVPGIGNILELFSYVQMLS